MAKKSKFQKYLESTKDDSGKPLPIGVIADKAGVCRMTMYNLLKKGKDVRGSVLIGIQRATKGAVTAKDLYEEFVEKK